MSAEKGQRMNMDLFNREPTGDLTPKRLTESHFGFLQRSDFVVARNIRRILADWLSSFPTLGRTELIGRLRSGDDCLFEGAFFELYMHEIIRRCGGVATIHPRLERNSRTPDFLVSENQTRDWFCEAKVVTEVSEEQRGRNALLDRLLERLEGIESPDFWLNVYTRGDLNTPPPESKIVKKVGIFLSRLDWEKLTSEQKRGSVTGLPVLRYKHEGCTIELKAMPRSETLRGGKGLRTLGALFLGGFKPIMTRDAVAKAIKKKATRYGQLDRPFVLALSTTQPTGGHEEIRAALFGNGTCSGAFAEWSRVSAVLAVDMLVQTTVASQVPVLYRNPNASHEYEGCLTRFERDRDGRAVGEDAEARIGDLLDLPDGWLWREDTI